MNKKTYNGEHVYLGDDLVCVLWGEMEWDDFDCNIEIDLIKFYIHELPLHPKVHNELLNKHQREIERKLMKKAGA
jgi:hypothetical protein